MSKEKLSRNEVRKKIIITLAQNNDGKIQKQTTEVMGIEIPENVVVTENTVDFLTTRIIERPLSDEQDAFLIAYIQNTDSIEEKQKYAWMFALKKRGFFISLLQKRFIGQELEDALVSAYIKLVDRILKPEFTCPITALYWKKLFSSIAAEVLTDKTFNTVVDNRDTFFASYQDNGYINKIHNIFLREGIGPLEENISLLIKQPDLVRALYQKHYKRYLSKNKLNEIYQFLIMEEMTNVYNEEILDSCSIEEDVLKSIFLHEHPIIKIVQNAFSSLESYEQDIIRIRLEEDKLSKDKTSYAAAKKEIYQRYCEKTGRKSLFKNIYVELLTKIQNLVLEELQVPDEYKKEYFSIPSMSLEDTLDYISDHFDFRKETK